MGCCRKRFLHCVLPRMWLFFFEFPHWFQTSNYFVRISRCWKKWFSRVASFQNVSCPTWGFRMQLFATSYKWKNTHTCWAWRNSHNNNNLKKKNNNNFHQPAMQTHILKRRNTLKPFFATTQNAQKLTVWKSHGVFSICLVIVGACIGHFRTCLNYRCESSGWLGGAPMVIKGCVWNSLGPLTFSWSNPGSIRESFWKQFQYSWIFGTPLWRDRGEGGEGVQEWSQMWRPSLFENGSNTLGSKPCKFFFKLSGVFFYCSHVATLPHIAT